MTKTLVVLIGAIILAMGLTFTLQGLGVLKGSTMSGETQWALIGPLVAVVGAGLLWLGFRRKPSPDGKAPPS